MYICQLRGHNIYAPIVISSAGVLNTYLKLIPTTTKSTHAESVRNALSLYAPSGMLQHPFSSTCSKSI